MHHDDLLATSPADRLARNSRVLFDFVGANGLSLRPLAGIKDSRIEPCCLDPTAKQSFFVKSNENELADAGREYGAADAAHYTEHNLPGNIHMCSKITDSQPNNLEAEHSRMQVQNIVNANS